jgi:hypothetical protein
MADVVHGEGNRRRTGLLVAGACVLATVVRVAFLLTPAGGLDGDEAVTGIMAHRMAAGDDLYVYFLGQTYNSAIEQYLQAVLFAVGLPETPLVLRIPQLAMAVLSIVLIHLIGRRMLRTGWQAVLVTYLFALGPYFLIWKGARSFGSYSAQMVVGLVALLLATDPRLSERRGAWFGLGLCAGLTYWLSLSGAYLVAPALLWAAGTIWRRSAAMATVAAGAVVGLVPVIYSTISAGALPSTNPGYRPSSAGDRFGNLFDEVGRELIGVAWIRGVPGWPIWLGRVTLWSLAAAVVVAAVVRWRGLRDLVTLRVAHREPSDLLIVSVVVTVAAYVSSKYAWFTTEPRYLFAAYPVLLLGLVRLLPTGGVRPPVRVVAAVAVTAFVALPSLTLLVSRSQDVPGDPEADLAQVIDVLEAEGQTAVYAAYWTAMPLEFYAADRLDVGTLILPERLLEERWAVDAAKDPVWVAARGPNSDDIAPMRSALARYQVQARERAFGDVVVFDRFSRPIRPWRIGLGVPAPPPPDATNR